ncbi:MAG: hypothetical protein KAV82_07675 [Phycisphaerae bacterium]|nr:hypothetical protein [Phycisphaerae bacterium]
MSYPVRCSLWGDSSYPGNCDGRLFKNLVLRYGAKRVADPMMGSGTTRDVVSGLNRVCPACIQYWGGDLHQGFNLLTDALPGEFDFIWLHPPYWNIVQYSKGDDGDLSSCESYPEFLGRLQICLVKCAGALVPGGRLAVLLGDVRWRGVYTPIVRDVLNMEHELGELRSIIIKAQHNCKSDSKKYGTLEDVPIKHEYCLVFKKRAGQDRVTERSTPTATETSLRREEMETERKQPVAQIRIGRLKATVWENSSSSSNGPWHNTQFCRLFKNDADGEWNESTNFGRDELLTLAELARETFRWIAEHEGRMSIRAGQVEPENAIE